VHARAIYRDDPAFFRRLCELGARHFERVRSYVDLADHYLCELIAQAQDEGHFEGLAIDRALTLINQMVVCYTLSDMLPMLEHRPTEAKLAAIIDTPCARLSARYAGSQEHAGPGPALRNVVRDGDREWLQLPEAPGRDITMTRADHRHRRSSPSTRSRHLVVTADQHYDRRESASGHPGSVARVRM